MADILADDMFIYTFSWMKINSGSNFTEIGSYESNWQLGYIGSGNGLVPDRHQANTWTNDYPVQWHIYATLGGDELIPS